jgi:hypothetical protein
VVRDVVQAIEATVRWVRVLVEHDEKYWYPDDGGIVWVAGYQLVDAASGRWLGRDAPELAAAGLRIAGAAGAARFHDAALQSDGAAPGRAVTLRRDVGNEYDTNAVAVDVDGGEQLGFLPRELAAELAPELDAGRPWSAVVLREHRASPRDPRTGVTLLLAPDASLELTQS